MTKSISFNIRADLFLAVAIGGRSTEETRYYLNGVSIEPHPKGGVLLVATDGHRLAIAHDPDGYVTGTGPDGQAKLILATDFKAKHLKTAKDVYGTLRIAGQLTEEGESKWRGPVSTMDCSAGETTGRIRDTFMAWAIDGTFPDWTRILPKCGETDNPGRYGFNVDYLATFGEALRIVEGKQTQGTRLNISGTDGGPVWVRGNTESIAFILMPVRWDSKIVDRPGFLDLSPTVDDDKPETAEHDETAEQEQAA